MKVVQEEWESIHASKEWGKWPTNELGRFLSNIRFRETPPKALDLGVGNGASSWLMSSLGFDVTGIDISKSAIERTREFLPSVRQKAELVIGDIADMPFPDASFALVVDICCLQCNQIADLPQIMSEVSRVLVKGGFFFSMFRSDESWLDPKTPNTLRLSAAGMANLVKPPLRMIALEKSGWTTGNQYVQVVHHLMTVVKGGEGN